RSRSGRPARAGRTRRSVDAQRPSARPATSTSLPAATPVPPPRQPPGSITPQRSHTAVAIPPPASGARPRTGLRDTPGPGYRATGPGYRATGGRAEQMGMDRWPWRADPAQAARAVTLREARFLYQKGPSVEFELGRECAIY